MDQELERDCLQHLTCQNFNTVSIQVTAEGAAVPISNLVPVTAVSCAIVWQHSDCFSDFSAEYKHADLAT